MGIRRSTKEENNRTVDTSVDPLTTATRITGRSVTPKTKTATILQRRKWWAVFSATVQDLIEHSIFNEEDVHKREPSLSKPFLESLTTMSPILIRKTLTTGTTTFTHATQKCRVTEIRATAYIVIASI